MVIEQKYVDIALEYTDFKREAQGVKFSESQMSIFKQTLEGMVFSQKYAEKQTMDDLSQVTYQNAVEILLTDAVRCAKADKDFCEKVDAREYMLSAFDYILALSSKILGSPDISLESFEECISEHIGDIIESKPKPEVEVEVETNITLEETYQKQRRVNAKDLEVRLSTLMNVLDGNELNPEALGSLYAEYKALTKRQANHGSLWRLFHRKENSARNELISRMEACLEKQYPGILKAENLEPADVIRFAEKKVAQQDAMEEKKAEATKDIGAAIKQYDTDTAKAFGYENERISLGKQLAMDTDIENTAKKPESKEETLVVAQTVIEEPVVEEPVVEEPVVEEPVVEEPKVEEPKVEEPVIEELKVEEPIVEQPVINESSKEFVVEAIESEKQEDIVEQDLEFSLFAHDSVAPAVGDNLNEEKENHLDGNAEFSVFDSEAALPAQSNEPPKPVAESENKQLTDKPTEQLVDKPTHDEEPDDDIDNEPAEEEKQEPEKQFSLIDCMMEFYDKISDLKDDEELAEKVQQEVKDVFEANGINEEGGQENCVLAVVTAVETIALIHDDPQNEEQAGLILHKMLTEACKMAFFSLDDYNLDMKTRAEVAQSVADIVLKNYSPIALANGKLNKYANSYVLNSSALTKDLLAEYIFDEQELYQLIMELTNKELMAKIQNPPVQAPVVDVKDEEKKEAEEKAAADAEKAEDFVNDNAPPAEEEIKEEPVVEEPVVEEPVVEEPVVEEPKVEEPVVEEPVVEEPKVEEPVVEEPVVEEPVVEEPKVEEPKVEEPKVEEPVVEELKVEESKVEEPKIEEPVVEEPKVEEPVVEEPKVEEPVVEEPKIEEPKIEEPKVEEPVVEEPVVEEPKVEEPVVEEIKSEPIRLPEEMIRPDGPRYQKTSYTISDGYKLLENRKLAQTVQDQMYDIFAKANSDDTRVAVVTTFMSMKWEMHNFWSEYQKREEYMHDGPLWLESMFEDTNKRMSTCAENAFGRAYCGGAEMVGENLSVADKIVMAQKIADLFIKTYSPVAFDPKMAKYGDRHFVKNAETLKDNITFLRENPNTLDKALQEAKFELGINKLQINLDEEFSEKSTEKSSKIVDHNVPTKTVNRDK